MGLLSAGLPSSLAPGLLRHPYNMGDCPRVSETKTIPASCNDCRTTKGILTCGMKYYSLIEEYSKGQLLQRLFVASLVLPSDIQWNPKDPNFI